MFFRRCMKAKINGLVLGFKELSTEKPIYPQFVKKASKANPKQRGASEWLLRGKLASYPQLINSC